MGKRVLVPIDLEVPIPRSRKRKYPFDTMKVGDSFLAYTASVRAAACYYSRLYGPKFTTREVDNAVWRCWRIK